VLIIGGGGAVGFAAVQLAIAVGCKVATTCGPQSVDRLLAAGVEQAVDYTSEVLKSFFDFYIVLVVFMKWNFT
jgi:reticulon-4-interacting protein 1, mitochondrial